jgi:hypothetical protein
MDGDGRDRLVTPQASGMVAPHAASDPAVLTPGITRDALLSKMDVGLRDMALGDIKLASRPGDHGDGGAKMAGFLLGFCFIDAMAGFYGGRTRQNSKRRGIIGKHFREFVRVYLTGYDPDALYHDLRSGLVHSYAIGDTYVFTHLEHAGKHLETSVTGFGVRTLINLEDFVSDLEGGYEALREDILTDSERFRAAKARYESLGLMTVA